MKHDADKIFLAIALFIVFGGIFVLASASIGLLTRNGADFYRVLSHQLFLGVGAGAVLFFAAYRANLKKIRKFSLWIFGAAFVAMLLVFVPGLGLKVGGASRWLNLRWFSFQPSEFMKLAFCIYLASWASRRKEKIKQLSSGLVPFLIMTGVTAALLIAQSDIGTLVVVVLSGATIFFLGGGKINHMLLAGVVGLLALYGLILMEPYRMDRVKVFLSPGADQQGAGWHLKQSLLALGSGGIFGRGFGMSAQKFRYLPEPIGDSVFAVFGEEFGFIGSLTLIALFIMFLKRGLRIAKEASDDFSGLLAGGIVIMIVVQTFINISAMAGILPLTGIPLVFVSKGGTALAIAMAEVGILLNISKHGNA